MKKKIAILLACVLSITLLFACGKEDEHNHEETSSTETILAEATIEPSYELVAVEGDVTELASLPVEEYITLGDYKTLSIEVTAMKTVTDEEVETTAAKYFMEDAAYLSAEDMLSEGAVVEGGVALIDFEGKIDGETFEGGSAEDYYLGIGSNSFIDGFEAGLVGVNVGETVDLELTFPETYSNADYAGKPVVFTVTVKAFAPYADEMIAALGMEGYATVDEYKEAVKLSLEYENTENYYRELNTALCNALVDVCEVKKLPMSYYEKQRTGLLESIISEASYYGMDGDTFAQYVAGANLNDYAISTAELYTIQACAFQAVANAEGIEITEEDIDAYVTDYVATYGEAYGIESEEAFLEFYSKETVKEWVMQEGVIAVLTESATITEV